MQTATQPVGADAAHLDSSPVRALVLDLLAWIEREPRSYAETLEAWRTSCPRLPVWEEALDLGLVRVETTPGLPMRDTLVRVTPQGRTLLTLDNPGGNASPRR